MALLWSEGRIFGVLLPITVLTGYHRLWFTWTPTESQGPGSYTFDVVVSDGTLTDSETITVDVNEVNRPPVVGPITAPADPVIIMNLAEVSASFSDSDIVDTHTAIWDWGDSTSSEGEITESNGFGSVSGNHKYSAVGVYTITLTVTDNGGESCESVYEYVVVYDPEGGFVTGGGWIDSSEGAYPADPTLTGKATFGFVSKYKKGATVPTGNTEFQFKAGDLNFHSDNYDWLVVTQGGANAQFKGSGTINGTGDYRFMIWAGDDDTDTFRIRIWEEDEEGNETVRYDNGFNQAIDSGSIVIHQAK